MVPRVKTGGVKMAEQTEKPVQFHATKQLLLDTVLTMLENLNPGSITSEQVLAKARVSTGSLYHHFEDFSDLLEQALCIEYEKFTQRTIDLLFMANEQATTLQEWAEGVQAARRISHGPLYTRNRTLRVWAVAQASLSERMKLKLGQAQDRLNEKFAEFVSAGQEIGWVPLELNPLAVGVFVQAYSFGSIINDIAITPLEEAEWIRILDLVTQKTFANYDTKDKN